MNHIPCHHVPTGHPTVFPDCLIPIDSNEIVIGTEISIKISCCHSDCGVLGKTSCSRFNDCEGLRKNFIQYCLYLLINQFDGFVKLSSKVFLFGDWNIYIFQLRFQVSDMSLFFSCILFNLFSNFISFSSQVIVR